jgi:hypothetical protein
MNKITFFLITILLIILLDFSFFEAPPSASQSELGSVTAESLVAVNNNGLDSNLGFDIRLGFNPENSSDSSSMTPGQVFDPVTMFLLGSGLIGLAGLGRKKA